MTDCRIEVHFSTISFCIEKSMYDSWHHQIFWKGFEIICLAKLKYALIFFGGLVSIFMEGWIKKWCWQIKQSFYHIYIYAIYMDITYIPYMDTIYMDYIYGYHIYVDTIYIWIPRGNFLLFLFILLYDSWVLNEIMFYTNVGMQLFWRQ